MARDTSHISRFSIMAGTNLPVPESYAAESRRLARQQPHSTMRGRSPTMSPTPAPRVAAKKGTKPAKTRGTDVLHDIGNVSYLAHSGKTASTRKIASRADSRLDKALSTKRGAGVGARSSTCRSEKRGRLAPSAMRTVPDFEVYKSTAGEGGEDSYSAGKIQRKIPGIVLLAQISGLVILADAAVDSPELPCLRRV
ncbi:hypothetical protein DFH06DRAFT_690853 [Mycena polygramma]|nr:hypothetical protein DFH06DRAFT_690853 [Mycena polygramma]